MQTLGDGFEYFFHGDGCVAYVDTGSAWVVAGAPIAPAEHLGEVSAAFVRAARHAGRRCCFVATEDRFVGATADRMRSFRIGEQPVWDPRRWADTVASHAGLREQLRRARAKRVHVREVAPGELVGALGEAAQRLSESWLATRSMPPLGFLVQLGPLGLPELRRCFVAEQHGMLVGIAYVIPVPQRRGWYLEHLVRAPQAPNGTVELLIDAVMRWAAERGSSWLTLGLAPLAGPIPRPLRLARRRVRALYDFEGLRRFKAKLRPSEWHSIYVTYDLEQRPSVTLFDVLAALTHDGVLRFGARTLIRGPSVVLAVFAALLVPWVLLVAAAPTELWFAGHVAVQWGWVVFDVLVLAALTRLVLRPSLRLSTFLAVAVTADASVTAVQVVVWNVPRLRGWADAAIVGLATIAPVLASVVLWGARARLRRLSPR